MHTNVGYDFVTHISDSIYREMVCAQQGEIRNFKLLHYSMLMHMILHQNIGHISPNFIEESKELGEPLPIQFYTRLWQHFYPFSNSLTFYNDFAYPIMRMIGPNIDRIPKALKQLIRLTFA